MNMQGATGTMPGQQNQVSYGDAAREIGPERASYMGVDLGKYIDFAAIDAAVKAAVDALPPEDRPANGAEWSATIIVHPGSATGSAFIMQPNPYNTWRW
jgi:hypothetical protein